MSFEADLFTLLKTVTPRVFPTVAPVSTPRPYVTWQQVGGGVLNPIDGTDPGVAFPEVQINVWADTKVQATALARAIEVAMRAATAFNARPLGDFADDYDADIPVHGTRQDFRCRHPA